MNEDVLLDKLRGRPFMFVMVKETDEDVSVITSASYKGFSVGPIDGLRQMIMMASRLGLDDPRTRALLKSVDQKIAEIMNGEEDEEQ